MIRIVSLLVLAVTLAAGCATASAPTPKKYGATGLASAYQAQTLYSCTGSTGTQLVFTAPKTYVSMISNGATVWVRPRSPLDAMGTPPTSPIPAANGVADGWVRLKDGQTASFGVEQYGASAIESAPYPNTPADLLKGVDVWCETTGDLSVVSH